MGINGINKLIQRHAANAFFSLPINKLSGKRIAVDGNIWMYTNMAIARKKVIYRTDIMAGEPNVDDIRREWFMALGNFVLLWLSYNVTPVFVFDGTHPVEKDDTKSGRREKRVNARTKIDNLYSQLRTGQGGSIEELRRELCNYTFISSEDYAMFVHVVRNLGLPCLQAAADGEQLCSMLCVEGKVAAVYSADTDNMVYGCPLVITGLSKTMGRDERGEKIHNLDCVRYDMVLVGINIPHSMFVDLCIMSGCDFNTNMPGYAALKSLALLRTYGRIENLPANLNTECLKYERCREIFRYVPSEKIGGTESLDINVHRVTEEKDFFEKVGILGQAIKIATCYSRIQRCNDGYIDELHLVSPARPVRKAVLNIIG